MWRQDVGVQPPHGAREHAEAVGTHAVLLTALEAPACRRRCRARAPFGEARPHDVTAPDRLQPGMQVAKAPTPGTTRPSAARAALRSAVTSPGRDPGQRPLGRPQIART